ncbi:MAG: 4-hydroxyphenylpyruvate dioxygenase [Acidobacteriota bacterium]
MSGKEKQASNGFPHINGYDYIELYTGNAKQGAHFFHTSLGFRATAYAGLETGNRDRSSIVMRQGDIHLILTAPLTPESEVAKHVMRHGDGVKDIAFSVDDAHDAFETAVRRGAKPVLEPERFEDDWGAITKATIAAYGSTVHSFIQREGECKTFLPGYRTVSGESPDFSSRLSAIDHLAIGLEPGGVDEWVEFYQETMGFFQSHKEDVATEYSAMRSKVVQSESGAVVFPMMEPAPGRRKSQIEEYLSFNRGPGVQHLALASDDIIHSVRTLRARDIGFLQTPEGYYETLQDRVGPIGKDFAALCELGILVDRDPHGVLMQVFTEPMQTRPTLFLEIIQRSGARGFGGGNIKALFEAVEREQSRRGAYA